MRSKNGQFVEGYKQGLRADNPNWKGDSISVAGIHKRLDREYGKPEFCESCGTESANRFDWANISGEYLPTRDDFLRLCRSCHVKFDYKPERYPKSFVSQCPKGHPYDIKNTYHYKGRRGCRACRNDAAKRHKIKRKNELAL